MATNKPQLVNSPFEVLERLALTPLNDRWVHEEEKSANQFLAIEGDGCIITLSRTKLAERDRGLFIANLIRVSDGRATRREGWPRYYWDEYRAKLEIEAWLTYQGKIRTTQTTEDER